MENTRKKTASRPIAGNGGSNVIRGLSADRNFEDLSSAVRERALICLHLSLKRFRHHQNSTALALMGLEDQHQIFSLPIGEIRTKAEGIGQSQNRQSNFMSKPVCKWSAKVLV